MARRFIRRSRVRSRHRWQWIRETVNNASPNATLNLIDVLTNWRTHAGITINLPEITIWRIKLRISIIVSAAGVVAANDGVLVTTFVDGMSQVALNQLTNGYDEPDLIYSFFYVTQYAMASGNTGAAGTIPLYAEYDIKSHRKLRAIDDTLFLQLAASGQTQITGYSYSAAILCKIGR